MRDETSLEGIKWQPKTAGYKQGGNDAINELCVHISFSFEISLHYGGLQPNLRIAVKKWSSSSMFKPKVRHTF